MMDLQDEIESYSPVTGQNNAPVPNIKPIQEPKNTIPLIDDSPKNQKNVQEQQKSGCTRYFSIEYYQQFFQVTQKDIFSRLKASIIPPYSGQFMADIASPDLYGPVWIMTTIVCLLGVVHNLSNYLLSIVTTHQVWQDYFFRPQLVRWGMVMVYSYGITIPSILYFLCRFVSQKTTPFLQLVCLYGYSLFVFVGVLLLSLIPISILQWVAVLAGVVNSTLFLLVNLKGHLEGNSWIVHGVVVGIAQLSFGILVKILFVELLI